MAFEKITYEPYDTLTADQVNKMQDAILANGRSCEAFDNFNQHWWKRVVIADYQMVVGEVQQVVICNASSKDSSAFKIEPYSEITVSESGALSLSGTAATASIVNYNLYTNGTKYSKGQYFKNGVDGKFYYVPTDANSYHDDENAYRVLIDAQLVSVENLATGTDGYVTSPNSDTYPHSGEFGGYEYFYIGNPVADIYNPAKIVSGSYTGSGSGTKSITLDSQPKAVFVIGYKNNSTKNIFYMAMPSFPYNGYTYSSGSKYSNSLIITSTGFNATYSGTNGESANESGFKYGYIAIV